MNERQIKAVMYVKEKGKITNKEYQEVAETTDRTALRDLKHLCELGIFQRIGTTGRKTEYILTQQKPDKNPTKKKGGATAMIRFRRETEFRDTEIGMVPKDLIWEERE